MKLLPFLGSFIVSYVGWWLGAFVGTTTAVVLSIVGMGVGAYFGKRWASNLLG